MTVAFFATDTDKSTGTVMANPPASPSHTLASPTVISGASTATAGSGQPRRPGAASQHGEQDAHEPSHQIPPDCAPPATSRSVSGVVDSRTGTLAVE